VEPLRADRRVIDAAEALARSLGDNDNHTVAAAVMDVDGRIYQAVNVYHFTGGPCAELVALGVAAAAGAKQLLTIAAAGDRGRGLIPPCGRCRQVLLDHHPDILVAVPAEKGPAVRPVRKLLPDTYFYPDAQGRRIFRFNKRYHDAVISGEKTTTIRWDEPVEAGTATFVFEDHPEFAHVEGEIIAVGQTRLKDLDAEHARGLKAHYPSMPDDAELSRVSFRVLGVR
jgi:cytidine deaminase